MLSSLGQDFMDMPGQNRVRQAVWSVWKILGFFWVCSLVWIQFDNILAAEGDEWQSLMCRRQLESAHPLEFLGVSSWGDFGVLTIWPITQACLSRGFTPVLNPPVYPIREQSLAKVEFHSTKSLRLLFSVCGHKVSCWNPEPFWSFIQSRHQLQSVMNVTLVEVVKD